MRWITLALSIFCSMTLGLAADARTSIAAGVEKKIVESIEKKIGTAIRTARDVQSISFDNGDLFYFLLTKGSKSSADEFDGIFDFFLFDAQGNLKGSKRQVKNGHIFETDGGRTDYYLNSKAFKLLHRKKRVLQITESYHVKYPGEIEGSQGSQINEKIYLLAIDLNGDIDILLDSFLILENSGAGIFSKDDGNMYLRHSRYNRILVPKIAGGDYPKLLIRTKKCLVKKKSKVDCLDNAKWRTESTYIFTNGAYIEHLKP